MTDTMVERTHPWWKPRYRVVQGHYESNPLTYSLQVWRWYWPWWEHVHFTGSSTIDGAISYVRPTPPPTVICYVDAALNEGDAK